MTAVMVVSFTMVKLAAGVAPKVTAVAAVNPVPVRVMVWFPAMVPRPGARPVTNTGV